MSLYGQIHITQCSLLFTIDSQTYHSLHSITLIVHANSERAYMNINSRC